MSTGRAFFRKAGKLRLCVQRRKCDETGGANIREMSSFRVL
uniref:Uncharacterized protein n=1 Tax=Rhizophora mucronata TaxID=61149 RepID=A0A2P2MBH5_RHIMU